MLEESINTKLTADLQESVQGRVFALLAPQGVKAPWVVYSKIHTTQGSTLCASDDVARSIFQIDVYAKTYKESKLTAKAVRDSFVDFKGTVGDTYIKTVKLENETDLLDVDPGLYRVLITLIFWHEVN